MILLPGYRPPDALLRFTPLSLEEMGRAGLQNRVESKYLLTPVLLADFLLQLQPDYYILQVGDQHAQHYRSHYYDTPDFRLYLDHHNGKAARIKVRFREYPVTGDCYFEIKQKHHEIRTRKTRQKTLYPAPLLSEAEYLLIGEQHGGYPALEWKLSNQFYRITLCNQAFTERITIDTGIVLSGAGGSIALEGLAVAEIKQLRPDHESRASRTLKAHGSYRTRFSKYAAGIALLYPELKHNNFKPLLTKLHPFINAST